MNSKKRMKERESVCANRDEFPATLKLFAKLFILLIV